MRYFASSPWTQSLVLCSLIRQATSLWPYQSYQTTDFHPPVLNISNNGHPSAAGYLFFAPDGPPNINIDIAPLIMDMDGELIWNGPNQHAFNFGVQTYKGENVLVAWNGTLFPEPAGRGNGEVFVWNKNYEAITKVTLPGDFVELQPGVTYPSNVDVHEQLITPQGTMLITANNVTQTDLRSVGGPIDGWIVEAQIYEIDVATNKVLFSWKSLDHLDQLPLNASVYPLGSEGQDGQNQSTPWGYFHINSVEPYGDGFIMSGRYLCSAVAIDRSGQVLWRLSGRDGADFKLGDGVDFCYQHDIRIVDGHRGSNGVYRSLTLQLHDNHNCPIDNDTVPTSGKVLDLDLVKKTATLKQRFLDTAHPVFATAQGSHRRLDNGNIFEGNGFVPVLQEYTPGGRILSTIQFGAAVQRPEGGFFSAQRANVTLSYRAFKQHWTGCPSTKPSVVATSGNGSTTVYVSWNGATEVKSWKIYGGGEKMKLLTNAKKSGFETQVKVKDVQRVQVTPVIRQGAPQDCGQGVQSDVVEVGSS